MNILKAKTVDCKANISDALKEMAHESERQLFVADGTNLVGVVTLRSLMDARSPLQTKVENVCFMPMRLSKKFDAGDALEFMLKTGLDALPVIENEELIGQVNIDTLLSDVEPEGVVADYMTPEPMTITPETTVSKARSIMRNYGIHRLLISKDGKKLDGIVTASDIVRKVLVPVERERKGDMGEKKISMYGMPVSSFMTENVETISASQTAKDALNIMIEKDLKALPVVEGKELVGILTKRTIVKTAMPKSKKGAWVRISGAEKLDYFTVSLIHKVVRDYVKKLSRKEKFNELELTLKGEYEVKARLIADGKRIRSTEAQGWDPVAVTAEALRKLEKGAKK